MPNDELEKLRDFFSNLPSRTGKPLSKITISNYVSKMNKLCQIVQGHNFNGDLKWVFQPDKVLKTLLEAQVTGKKDFLSPVLRILKTNHPNETKLIETYQKGLSNFKTEEYDGRKKNHAKESLTENSLPLDEIKTKIQNYKPTNEGELQNLLICSLYFCNTLVPRNDLNIVKLVSEKKKGKDLNREFNYLLMSGNEPKSILMNNYKSAHTFGSKKFPLTDMCAKLLKAYIEATKRQNGEFLFSKRGEPYSKNAFLDVIGKATEAVLGKRMGVDLMRQINVTDYYRKGVKTIEEDERDAERFLHGLGQHKEYYRGNLADGSGSEGDD